MLTLKRFGLVLLLAVPACGGDDVVESSCTQSCTSDADCSGAQTCGSLGLCTTGEACTCNPGDFLSCAADGVTARNCNPAGDGIALEACGSPGCSATEERCLVCAPDSQQCNPDNTEVETCSADGLSFTAAACSLGCLTDHCASLEPVYLPDICDTPVMGPLDITTATTIDTGMDLACTGGIVVQTVGPELCVLRHTTITIGANVRAVGKRPLVLVADDALEVTGDLDLSSGTTGGAGAGTIVSGDRAGLVLGGGGAGFRTAGAAGGSATTLGGGAAGGAAVLPSPVSTGMIGGARPLGPTATQLLNGFPSPGTGGGGVMLISCRGTVTVSGVIAANGSGGFGGKDVGGTASNYIGGTGGGSGGHVIIQGAQVVITGSLYANGGAGGGGCSGLNCNGTPGQHGQRSTTPATGGQGFNSGGKGGNGGTGVVPTGGASSAESPGGGGGAAGRFRVYTPAGISPTLTPAVYSPPAIETDTVPLR